MIKKTIFLVTVLILTIGTSTYSQVASPKNLDPSGVATGTASDIPAATPGSPTLEEVATAVGHNKVSINMMWVLIAGFLVMFMQAGFAMVEGGLTRAKNAAHTIAMNFLIYPLGMLGFYVCGFALMFGGFGALGTLGGADSLNSEFSFSLGGHVFGLFGMKRSRIRTLAS